MSKKFISLCILVLSFSWSINTLGNTPASATGIRTINPPFGLVDYCARDPQECNRVYTQTKGQYIPFISKEWWKVITFTNMKFNHEVKQINDIDAYGVVELWTLPRVVGGSLVGDCEDIALAKRKALLEAGWPQDKMYLAVARLPEGILHTMLVISSKQGDFVLDNMTDEISKVEDRSDLKWVAFQRPMQMLSWFKS